MKGNLLNTSNITLRSEILPVSNSKDFEEWMFSTIHKKKSEGKLQPLKAEAFENEFREEVRKDIDKMIDTFTWKENMMIAFAPLMIANMAWTYAEKVTKYCAAHRILQVRSLGRAIKQVKSDYEASLNKDLDWKHIHNIENKTKIFIEENKRDFTILWFSVNSAIKREYPEMEFSDMRTDACICIYLIDFLWEHNKRMDDIITSKMGPANSIMHPDILRLKTLVDAYLPVNFAIKGREQIDLALRIIQNDVERINFVLSDGEPDK